MGPPQHRGIGIYGVLLLISNWWRRGRDELSHNNPIFVAERDWGAMPVGVGSGRYEGDRYVSVSVIATPGGPSATQPWERVPEGLSWALSSVLEVEH